MRRHAFASVALLAAAASCATPVTAPTTPTITVTATVSATVAFPTVVPTPTWTPGPTLTAAAPPLPALGPVILREPFDDASAWDLPSTPAGGAAVTDGRLSLSVHTPRAFYAARRPEPIVAGFYAEVDVFPEVCNPGDEFGLTARGNAAGEQYRFLLGCDGTARITRLLEEGSRALTLKVENPAILAGAPSHNHLAVWAHGLDLRMMVNGNEVLAARDASRLVGSFGVIARAGSGGQVSVGFDDLVVYALQEADATVFPAAPTSAASPLP